jgi:hypothetical protein
MAALNLADIILPQLCSFISAMAFGRADRYAAGAHPFVIEGLQLTSIVTAAAVVEL